MGPHIACLRAELQIKLEEIERHASELLNPSSCTLQETIRQIQEQLEQLRRRIDLKRERIRKAEVEVLRWIERRGETRQRAGRPKTSNLAAIRQRFTEAERYANAALDLALAAVDDAEYAAVDALCAEHEMAHAEAPGSGTEEQ